MKKAINVINVLLLLGVISCSQKTDTPTPTSTSTNTPQIFIRGKMDGTNFDFTDFTNGMGFESVNAFSSTTSFSTGLSTYTFGYRFGVAKQLSANEGCFISLSNVVSNDTLDYDDLKSALLIGKYKIGNTNGTYFDLTYRDVNSENYTSKSSDNNYLEITSVDELGLKEIKYFHYSGATIKKKVIRVQGKVAKATLYKSTNSAVKKEFTDINFDLYFFPFKGNN